MGIYEGLCDLFRGSAISAKPFKGFSGRLKTRRIGKTNDLFTIDNDRIGSADDGLSRIGAHPDLVILGQGRYN